MALTEFGAAQINAVYDIDKCVAPYKRDDLDWDYGIQSLPYNQASWRKLLNLLDEILSPNLISWICIYFVSVKLVKE